MNEKRNVFKCSEERQTKKNPPRGFYRKKKNNTEAIKSENETKKQIKNSLLDVYCGETEIAERVDEAVCRFSQVCLEQLQFSVYFWMTRELFVFPPTFFVLNILFSQLTSAAEGVLQCIYLGVDESNGGFRAHVLLIASSGRSVETQHSIMRICNRALRK